MEGNFSLVNENDDLQDIFSKYGALALEKQDSLARIVGEKEPELDIEKGIVKFGDIEYSMQLIGFLNPDEFTWSWVWDNEDIGFPEELIKEAKSVKEFGHQYNIPQFTEGMFAANFEESHILTMVVSTLFNDDAYCAVNFGNFVFFVTIQSEDIKPIGDAEEFANMFNDFHRKFEVNHLIALKSYAELKGYEFKVKDDFVLVKAGIDRVIIGLTERKNIQSIKVIRA